jgi:pyrroline-5-carboxylate reductase
MRIAFIGGGIMANALISGMYEAHEHPEWIRVCDPNEEARLRLESRFPAECFPSVEPVGRDAHVVVLATKPQVGPVVLAELSRCVEPGQLIISIAAGIRTGTISEALSSEQPIIRTMPNTPAVIGKGITGLFAAPGCKSVHHEMAEHVVAAAGASVWVEDEDLIDVITALSGSGPAYYFLLTESLREAGRDLGLPGDVASKLAMHTAHGASAMAMTSDVDIAELRKRVTTPGGTTEAALEVFESGHFRELVRNALGAATKRGVKLAHIGDTE